MATPSQYSALLGYDPREDELARRKLWAGAYASASSPWEKIGLGLSQLGGSLFDKMSGDESSDPVAQINKVATDAGQQYTPGSSDYYKYIAENISNPSVRQNASMLYQKALKEETTQSREQTKYLKENPELLAAELEPLTTRLENRAKLLYSKEGYDPASGDPIPDNIMKKLETSPEYKKILQLSTTGQTAIIDRAQKEEKEALGIETSKLTITKLKQDISNAGKTEDAAVEFMSTYGLDPTKPIPEQIAKNPALANLQYVPGVVQNLMNVQKKALEKKKPTVIKIPS